MMTDQEVTQEQFGRLIDDIAYLQDEAEALKYVIEQVPYTEQPPDGLSIYSLLKLLDHAQINFFRPIVEKVFSESRVVNISDFEHFEKSFEEPPAEDADVEKALNKIIKHRAALLNVFTKIPLIDWERGVKNYEGDLITLYEFSVEMVKAERAILKAIADLVMVYQNDRMTRREVDARSRKRKPE